MFDIIPDTNPNEELLPPPFTEEEKQALEKEFNLIKLKLLDKDYELTLEEQRIIVRRCRAFRATAFYLNKVSVKPKKRKTKQVDELDSEGNIIQLQVEDIFKTKKNVKKKKEKVETITPQKYRELCTKQLMEAELTEEETKAITLYEKTLLKNFK